MIWVCNFLQAAYLKLRKQETAEDSVILKAYIAQYRFHARFFKSVSESNFSQLKPMIKDGSHIEMYQCLSIILTANNDGEDIKFKLESLSSKYKSEPSELFNDI